MLDSQSNMGVKIFFKKLFDTRRYIMYMVVNLDDMTVMCVDWISANIKPFCGKLTKELWDEISQYCSVGDWSYTKITIWKGKFDVNGNKIHGGDFRVNMEPVEPYVNNYDLVLNPPLPKLKVQFTDNPKNLFYNRKDGWLYETSIEEYTITAKRYKLMSECPEWNESEMAKMSDISFEDFLSQYISQWNHLK